MKVVGIDPAGLTGKSGVSEYLNGGLSRHFTLRRIGGGPSWAMWVNGDKVETYPSRRAAWESVLWGADIVVCEQAWVGVNPGTGLKLARGIGYIEGAYGGERFALRTPSEWRRIVRETWPRHVTWPRNSDEAKALSVDLVRERWGVSASIDESDAILIGWSGVVTNGVRP